MIRMSRVVSITEMKVIARSINAHYILLIFYFATNEKGSCTGLQILAISLGKASVS